MIKEEFTLRGSDGKAKLHCISWKPEENISCVVQLVHGMAEYVNRYEDFAEFLVKNGVAVIGHDHLGHGKTAESIEKLGYFAKNDGDKLLVEDIAKVTEEAKKRWPDVPLVIIGHSMGSFLVRRYITKHCGMVQGVVLLGTGNKPFIMLQLLYWVSSIMVLFKQGKKPCPAIQKMMFFGYNRKFQPINTPDDWLTRNQLKAERYGADEYCGFPFTVAGYRDLSRLLLELAQKKDFSNIDRNLPVLLASGDMDPVGSYGRGVRQVYGQFQNMGMTNVEMRLYKKDRHELLNEPDKDEIFQEIYEWMLKNLKI